MDVQDRPVDIERLEIHVAVDVEAQNTAVIWTNNNAEPLDGGDNVTVAGSIRGDLSHAGTAVASDSEEDDELDGSEYGSDDDDGYEAVGQGFLVWMPSETRPFDLEAKVGEDGGLEAALQAMSAWRPQQLRGPRISSEPYPLCTATFD